MQKSADAFRTISEVADDLSLPQHVLRFWETRFPQIRPLKRAGGRRYYRPTDISLLRAIRQLLYEDGYTIKGVQRLLKEQGARDLGAGGRTESSADLLTDPSELDEEILGEDLAPENRPSEPIASVDDDERRAGYASGPARDLIIDALTTVEDCRRILDALLASGRRNA